MTRERTTWKLAAETEKLGTGTRERSTWKEAAAAPTGLYGYTRSVQADCEGCIRKATRSAQSIAKRILAKDERTAEFLLTHSKRAGSLPAKVLHAAMKDVVPKLAHTKEAGSREYGLYGFSAKTARLGLTACAELREAAGLITADLHARRADSHEKITAFLDDHCKSARCNYAKLLRASYPDAEIKINRTASSEVPSSVAGWLEWEP